MTKIVIKSERFARIHNLPHNIEVEVDGTTNPWAGYLYDAERFGCKAFDVIDPVKSSSKKEVNKDDN